MEAYSDEKFDNDFSNIQNLTWMPWVGLNYSNSEEDKKILVIGESHYYNGNSTEELETNRKKFTDDDQSTRDIISPLMKTPPWPNKTFENFYRTIFTTTDFNVSKFWNLLCFHNIIQRPMNYSNRLKERPNSLEFYNSWKVFVDIVKVLRPQYCIFIGVEASKSFDAAMKDLGLQYTPIKEGEHISNTFGRTAEIFVGDKNIKLIFIQHTGSFYKWSNWNQYIHNTLPDMMNWLNKEIL